MKVRESFFFAFVVALIISLGVACTHFSMKIGELKDAEMTLDNGTKENK